MKRENTLKKSAFFVSYSTSILARLSSEWAFSLPAIPTRNSHRRVLAIGCQIKDPPPHNVLFSTPQNVFRSSACTTPLSTVGSKWCMARDSKEREAEMEGRILAAVGSVSILIMSSARIASLGDLNSFLRQLHGAADIGGSLLCVPLLSLVFSLQCLGKKGKA